MVLNRVRHPAYPNTVCGVVFEGARRYTGCQFSFSCDGSLRRGADGAPIGSGRGASPRRRSNGYVYAPVGWATHYHANYVVPYWASSLVKSATVGRHIFYRWRGGWGRAAGLRSAAMRASSRRSPGAAASASRSAPSCSWRPSARDAAAAAAAAEADAPLGSVDSFQRAVLRRYEPLRRDTANAVIAERARADRTLTTQPALGADRQRHRRRRAGAARPPREGAEQPRELQGVRYRWDPAPRDRSGQNGAAATRRRAERRQRPRPPTATR